MNDINEIVLTGTVGKQDQIRVNDTATSFTIAVTRNSKKGTDGKWSGQTDWIKVTFFGTVEGLSQGARVKIYGSYRNNNYTKKDGTKVYADNVVAEVVKVYVKNDAAKNTTETTAQEWPKEASEQTDDIPF